MKKSLLCALLLGVGACDIEGGHDIPSRIEALQRAVDIRVCADLAALATFESTYNLVYKNAKEGWLWRADNFYFREEVAYVPYGYQLSDIAVNIKTENGVEYLHVTLPDSPQRLPITRRFLKSGMTDNDFEVTDEKGQPVDVDAKLNENLNQLLAHHEAQTFQYGRNLTHQYFINLAYSLGLKPNIEFTK